MTGSPTLTDQSALTHALLSAHRGWEQLFKFADLCVQKKCFEEALEIYEAALERTITLIEKIEHALDLKIPVLEAFTRTTQAMARLYEKIHLPEEAERLLLTHYISLQKMMETLSAPLLVRDLARQEIFRSREQLVDLYHRHQVPNKAHVHEGRCRKIYYSLLA